MFEGRIKEINNRYIIINISRGHNLYSINDKVKACAFFGKNNKITKNNKKFQKNLDYIKENNLNLQISRFL